MGGAVPRWLVFVSPPGSRPTGSTARSSETATFVSDRLGLSLARLTLEARALTRSTTAGATRAVCSACLERTELRIDTASRLVTDLSPHVERFCRGKGDGLLHVFAPHATAGLALMELGSGSEEDLARLVERILPGDDQYVHRHGSPGHGRDHLLPTMISPSLVLAVSLGRVELGTWQRIALVDSNRDNPVRTVRLSFIAG